jgi:hypothetical protein
LSAKGFEYGVFVNCTIVSINGNRFYPGEIFNNQYGLFLQGVAPGYINGNVFLGGRWSEAAAYSTASNRYGVYFKDAGTNLFYGPLIEIVTGGTGKAYTIYYEGESKNNRFEGAYIEGQDYIFGVSGGARGNKILAFASANVAADVSTQFDEALATYPGANSFDWMNIIDNTVASNLYVQEVFGVTSFVKNAVVSSNINPNYIIPGFTFCASNGVHSINSSQSFLNASALFIDTAAIGRWVDTNVTKRFWLSINAPATSQFCVIVVAYNAAGAILSAAGLVRGMTVDLDNMYPFKTTVSYGGAFWIEDFINKQAYFNVDSTVKSIWVGVRSYAVPTPIYGMSLKCEGNQAPPYSNAGYDLVTAGAYFDNDLIGSLAIPEGGVFNNGTKIEHIDAATGETSGWFVTDRRSTTANGGEPAGEVVVAVNSIAGVTTGDTMGVIITAGADTRWHWTTVNGAPAAGNITMTAGVPLGWTIANGAIVITYRFLAMANLP